MSITIAILAGGAATRLGERDKGLEPWCGRPLIAWAIDAIRRMEVEATEAATLFPDTAGDNGIAAPAAPTPAFARCELLIIANRNLDEYSRHARTICDDAQGFRGPLAGVATALGACATTWLLTVPVDCPEPPHDLAARLFQVAQASGADAVVAHDGERRQPLFAIYRRDLAASAAAGVEAGQGVRQWQTSTAARELDFSDRKRQFRNLNTPEDFVTHADRNDP